MLDKTAKFKWDGERENALRVAVQNGFTASQIACAFADRYGLAPSRNAVIGKANRLGLSLGLTRTAAAPHNPRAPRNFPWTPAADERLRALVMEGKTVREIILELARVFYAAPKPSELAIRTRVSRIGVSLRNDRPAKPNSASESSPPTKAQDESGREDPMQRLPSAIIPENGGVTLIELQHDACRWPYGDARDLDTFRYCGAAAASGRPYCAGHTALAYIPLKKRPDSQHSEEANEKRRVAMLRRQSMRADGSRFYFIGGLDG